VGIQRVYPFGKGGKHAQHYPQENATEKRRKGDSKQVPRSVKVGHHKEGTLEQNEERDYTTKEE
jgi:hypothetical protein